MDRILSAPEPAIRAVLVALCDDEHLRDRCHAYLDQLDKHHATAATTTTKPSSKSPDSSPPNVILGKRKISSFPPQICIQCNTAFGPDANHPGACPLHDNDDDDGTGGAARGLHVAIRGEHEHGKRRRRADPGQDPDHLARTFEGRVLRANEFVNENRWGDDGEQEEEEEDDDGSGEMVGVGVGVGGRLPPPPAGIVSDHDDDDDDDDDGDVVVDDVISDKTERDSGGGGSDSQDGGD